MARRKDAHEQITKAVYVIRGDFDLTAHTTVPQIITHLEECQERLRELGSADVEVTIPAPQTIKF